MGPSDVARICSRVGGCAVGLGVGGCEDVPVDDADDVRYAMSGNARLAFKIRGPGLHEIVVVPSWLSNLDAEPPSGARSFTDRLSSFATVVSYDQRGTGSRTRCR
jgi:hypothetical protein